MNRLKILLSICYIWISCATHAQINPYDYLKLNVYKKDMSALVLKETYTINKSKNSEHKKKFLSAREEYDEEGRTALTLCFDPEGDMTSKIITYYPTASSEKNIFQQRGSFLDSVVYRFNAEGLRMMEVWHWGESRSEDTISYSYNRKKQLTGVTMRYGWDTKRDTLIYKDGLLQKALTYSSDLGLQKEVDFVYGYDSTLIKANLLNSQRLVVEEEFFYYNNKGQVHKSIAKYYPDGEELLAPPNMVAKYKYYPNNKFKEITKTVFNEKGKKTSVTKLTYTPEGHLMKEQNKNDKEGINKTTVVNYTIRKK
ncbi:MAG: hypothetical protein GY810_05950 [Aureispira sp.]|nr:hypothetical protein [Aureispira sp.]